MRLGPPALLAAGLAAGFLVLCASPAAAQEDDPEVRRAQELFRKGNLSYDLGRYDEAIAFFQLSYEASGEPLLLYNIAQAHRRKGDCAQARDGYENFVRRAGKAQNRGDYHVQLEQAEGQVRELRQQCPAIPQVVKPVATPVVTAPLPAAAPAPAEGNTRKILGWVTLSVGTAALAGGGYTGYRAESLRQQISDAPTYVPEDDRLRRRHLGWTWGLLGAGVALAGVSAVLFFSGDRK